VGLEEHVERRLSPLDEARFEKVYHLVPCTRLVRANCEARPVEDVEDQQENLKSVRRKRSFTAILL